VIIDENKFLEKKMGNKDKKMKIKLSKNEGRWEWGVS